MISTAALVSALTLASAVVASPFHAVKSQIERQVDQPIVFNGLTYEGEGCPAGSITTGELDFENWQFEIFYANLMASIGTNFHCFCKTDFVAYNVLQSPMIPSKISSASLLLSSRPPLPSRLPSSGKHISLPNSSHHCYLNSTRFNVSRNKLTLLSGDYKGHVNITEGVYAKQQNQYKFKDNEGVTNMQWEFTGPVDTATVFTNVMNTTLLSPCQSAGSKFTMIINNYLTLTTEDGGSGSISVAGIDDAGIMQSIKFNSTSC